MNNILNAGDAACAASAASAAGAAACSQRSQRSQSSNSKCYRQYGSTKAQWTIYWTQVTHLRAVSWWDIDIKISEQWLNESRRKHVQSIYFQIHFLDPVRIDSIPTSFPRHFIYDYLIVKYLEYLVGNRSMRHAFKNMHRLANMCHIVSWILITYSWDAVSVL